MTPPQSKVLLGYLLDAPVQTGVSGADGDRGRHGVDGARGSPVGAAQDDIDPYARCCDCHELIIGWVEVCAGCFNHLRMWCAQNCARCREITCSNCVCRCNRGELVGAAGPAGRDGLDSEPEIEETAWLEDRAAPSVRPGQLGQIVDAAAAAGASGVGGPPSLIREAVTSQGQAQHLAWMAMAAVASEPQGEDGSPPPPSPPPLFFSTIFAPPPPGPPGSGVGRLHGWPRAPPAVTHEGPMTLVAWLAPRTPPHFRGLADWLEYLEREGLIRTNRYGVIVLTEFESF